DRARRTVGQPLEDARAEPHQLAVRALVDVVVGLPGAPGLDRVGDPRRHRLGCRGRGRVARLGRDPAEREAGLLAVADGERRAHRHILDGHRNAGADRDAVRPAERAAAVALLPEQRPNEAILGARRQLYHELDLTGYAFDAARQFARVVEPERVPALTL